VSGAGGGGETSSVAAELDVVLDGCRASHRRLLATMGHFDHDAVRAPSNLAGWTVGHVLTHLARNADSHTRMLRAALSGDAVEQYADGAVGRAEAIDAGASREASALRDDVARSTAELEETWAAMTPDAWDGHGLTRGRQWPCRTLPYARWREVEVHHADLGRGYGQSDWPIDYVDRELPLVLATVPERIADDDARRRLLAWLIGRGDPPGLVAPGASAPGGSVLAPWESRPTYYLDGISRRA
jgi:maleylpyruvate isomerase